MCQFMMWKHNLSPGKSYIHQDGYEVSFVKGPPQELQLECSICLQLLSDPCLLDCECGSSFCRKCIETIQSHKSPCPLCNEKFKIVLLNKQLEQVLNSLLVHCPHSNRGCSWVDKLAKISQHFNQLPIEGTRLEGCEHIAIPCRFCEKPFPRKSIPQHETELCPNKPYTCQYCGHESILNDVTENHWPVCDKFPLPCPYECGDSPPREELESHVMSVCELAPIECEFKYAGCEVGELPRKEMTVHLRENLVKHTSLLAIKQREEVETLHMENQRLRLSSEYGMETLQAENQNLKLSLNRDMETLHKEYQSLKSSMEHELETVQVENKTLKRNVELLKRDNTDMEQACDTLRSLVVSVEANKSARQVQNIASQMSSSSQAHMVTPPSSLAPRPSHLGPPPVELVVNHMEQLKEYKNMWTSAPFYSRRGYKMLLGVNPSGRGCGLGRFVAVYVYLLKGEYDDSLCWPFQGGVTVTLINQQLINQQLGNHRSVTFSFDDELCGKRRSSNSLTNGVGWDEFIEYQYLCPNYLKNDRLVFRVDDILDEWF